MMQNIPYEKLINEVIFFLDTYKPKEVLPYEDIIPYHLTFSEKLICKKLFF
jgi:hypothetical protein